MLQCQIAIAFGALCERAAVTAIQDEDLAMSATVFEPLV